MRRRIKFGTSYLNLVLYFPLSKTKHIVVDYSGMGIQLMLYVEAEIKSSDSQKGIYCASYPTLINNVQTT